MRARSARSEKGFRYFFFEKGIQEVSSIARPFLICRWLNRVTPRNRMSSTQLRCSRARPAQPTVASSRQSRANRHRTHGLPIYRLLFLPGTQVRADIPMHVSSDAAVPAFCRLLFGDGSDQHWFSFD